MSVPDRPPAHPDLSTGAYGVPVSREEPQGRPLGVPGLLLGPAGGLVEGRPASVRRAAWAALAPFSGSADLWTRSRVSAVTTQGNPLTDRGTRSEKCGPCILLTRVEDPAPSILLKCSPDRESSASHEHRKEGPPVLGPRRGARDCGSRLAGPRLAGGV